MSFLLVSIQILLFAGVALAAVFPARRRLIAAGIALAGVASLVAAGLAGTAERTLAIGHRFSAYVELRVENKLFPIEVTQAPGFAWGLCIGAFALGWALWLGVLSRRQTGPALGEPLALAWTGIALQLGLEKAAAPEILLAPFDLAPDRVLFPATLAGAYLLARPGRKILHLVLYLTLFIAVTRLPLAVLGTLATQNAWGTHLDVHGTVYFVPPGGGTEIGAIQTAAGSSEQLFWLVWAPHLLVYPMFYLMSTGGIAFLRLMWSRQQEENRAVAAAPPTAPPDGS